MPFLGIALGCMAWLMLQFLTGGAWGVVIRRPAEAAVRTLPLLAVLFIPIVIGIPALYSWSHADVVAADAVLKHKAAYLNYGFFLGRAVFYFTGWLFCGWYLHRWSDTEDRMGGVVAHEKMAGLSAPGVLFWGVTVTFMSIDWVMSLEPHWFSTMYGLLFIAGQALSSMAFLIAMIVLLSHYEPMSRILTARHLHDLGKLLLACVMLWAYFSFSQFLIIWTGNLPEEIPFYLRRLTGGWWWLALLLVVGHFALPFALLLSRDVKKNFKLISRIAVFILLMRFIDIYWQAAPDTSKGVFSPSWMDLTAPIGIGGIWLAYFLLNLAKRPLMPVNDPHLEEALEHGRE
ncbi:quinol:cytochrome c oxidoreductase membrane protein 2 [Candidatus Sulfopaludibacter sp. SbA3]|nr:quinol:cytochrome c oxidoreductase membrane protein 2 [Candidatus Sulfopaludibacter sp. SbA3]